MINLSINIPMKILLNGILVFVCVLTALKVNAQTDTRPSGPDQRIFIYGGGMNKIFIRYLAEMTGKSRPKICYLPTASADNANGINNWYELCHDLPVEPFVQRTFINSYEQKETFAEVLLNMDAIVVGGGNTLNMLAIWKAQGIDTVLREALVKGIILSGGSAGSLCWFVNGTTDSRPKELSILEGLKFLKYSHCPHYHSEESRRPLYFENIKSGKLLPGYAVDDKAALLFVNGKVSKALSLDSADNSYFVYLKDGEIKEDKLESEIIK
jgi:dipeptidase E